MDNLFTWTLAGIGIVVSTLAAAVGTLWKMNETRNAKDIAALALRVKETEDHYEVCDKDRQAQRIEIVKLQIALGHLKGDKDDAG